MGDFALRCVMSPRPITDASGMQPDDYIDTVYVGAISEHGARAAALATWPRIRTILSCQERFY
jgi:hypothetical protein